MPEFERLRSRAFSIAVTDERQGRGGDVPDVIDGRAFCVDLWVFVNRGPEVWNHPLVDGVFAVVGEPVGDACPRHRRTEAVGLRDGKHGHESAVAPAVDTDAIGVDRIMRQNGIDAGENVAEIAVAEVLAVGLGEGFTLAVAATWIGLEDKNSRVRKEPLY